MNKNQYRYRIVANDEYTIVLRDDGYRICYLVIEPFSEETRCWKLWADYRQNGNHELESVVADALMQP